MLDFLNGSWKRLRGMADVWILTGLALRPGNNHILTICFDNQGFFFSEDTLWTSLSAWISGYCGTPVTSGEHFRERTVAGPVELENESSLITFMIFTKIFNDIFFFFLHKSKPMIASISINDFWLRLHASLLFCLFFPFSYIFWPLKEIHPVPVGLFQIFCGFQGRVWVFMCVNVCVSIIRHILNMLPARGQCHACFRLACKQLHYMFFSRQKEKKKRFRSSFILLKGAEIC